LSRLVTVGNGAIAIFGYEIAPLGLFVFVITVLAIPETLDRLPFGPSKK